MRRAALLASLALAGCATYQPVPKIVTKTVEVPVPVLCPDKRQPPPAYPDTPPAIDAAPDLFARVQLLLEGRTLRDERLKEDDAQIAACGKP